MSIYQYGKFVKDDVITLIPAVGSEVVLPDLLHDLFDGVTVKPEELVEKYGPFQGFINDNKLELPDLRLCEVLIDKWTILQFKEKVN